MWLTEQLPDSQRYVVCAQLQRAALSIPLKIAEGVGRQKSGRDFANFLGTALGSVNEVLVLLDLTVSLNYVSDSNVSKLREDYEHLVRHLSARRQSVKKRSHCCPHSPTRSLANLVLR